MITNNSKTKQKAYLIGIDLKQDGEAEVSMNELSELVKTAGGEVFDCIIQNRRTVDPKICIGSGKLFEIRDIMKENDINLAVFDIELAPSQINNIAEILDCAVIDRTIVILDIFALRARTSEGKLQVELAQLKHRYNKLRGKGNILSRLGGGIGTRGPGESQLETDKRHIRRRMDKIEDDLKKVETRRSQMRANRTKNNFKTISLVGYTNAGKSTLFNALTKSDILAEDMLFATLDPTARRVDFSSGDFAMLVDTVGFIRNLPHFLINAFKSTLEEVIFSDLVLLVCDISDKNCFRQQEIAIEILKDLGYNKDIIFIYNKIDKNSENISLCYNGFSISAKENIGLVDLKNKIQESIFPKKELITLKIPYERQDILSNLRGKKCIIREKYEEKCQIVEISIDKGDIYMYNDFITNVRF